MTPLAEQGESGRPGRARQAILGAFVGLVLTRRYGDIRVAEIIANAGVARSTFYEHFRRKEDVLLASLEPILVPLAEAACGRPDPARLDAMLRHMWERRALARMLFDSRAGPLMQRHLADMVVSRLAADRLAPLLARGCAAGQLAMLRMWLTGEIACTSVQLAEAISAHMAIRGG